MTMYDRETLEQLLSDWLDAPDDAVLARQVESAIGDDPERIVLRDRWLRLHAALCAEPVVDWARQRERIMAALSAAPRSKVDLETRLDELIRAEAESPDVDWADMKSRILDRLDTRRRSPAVIRFPARRRGWIALGLAAAAALWITPWGVLLHSAAPRVEPVEPAGTATLRIHSPALAGVTHAPGESIVRMRVARLTISEAASAGSEAEVSEDWLMIDPPAVARVSAEEEYGMF